MRSVALSAFAALVLVTPGAAQLLQAELQVGDPLPWPPGHVVKSLGQLGGGHWGLSLVSTDGAVDLSHVFGTCCFDVGAQSAHVETTIGTFQQTSFDDPVLFAGALDCAYSATGIDLSSGTPGLDSVWVSDGVTAQSQLFALEGDPIPSLAGSEWGALDQVSGYFESVAVGYVPSWLGDIVDTGTGALVGRGLFLGTAAQPLLKTGDVVPGTGGPIALDGLRDRYAVAKGSAGGARSIAQVRTTEPAGSNHYLLLDGAALTVAGSIVREGELVPASIGGLPGERWESFGEVGLLKNGGWYFSANTDAPAGQDEVLVENGTIFLREGDAVDGEVLAGGVTWSQAFAQGPERLALVWGVAGPGGPRAAVLLDCDVLARLGDGVDLDGDGQPDPGVTLSEIGSVQRGELNQVFLVAKADVNGTPSTADDVQALLRVQATPAPYGIGKLNSLSFRSILTNLGTPLASANDFSLFAFNLVPNNIGIAIWGHGAAQIPFANHFLYVQPPVNRILPPVFGGPAGMVSVPIPIDATMVGTSRFYQLWGRDPAHPDGTGVELTNGLEVHFCP